MDTTFLNERELKLLEFVKEKHGEQKRKYTGEPYWHHLVSVAKILDDYSHKILIPVALCHDLLEDTTCWEQEIYDILIEIGYTENESLCYCENITELTDEFTKEKYPHFNREQRKTLEANRLHKISYDAQTVKFADLIDNTSSITEHDPKFAVKYLKEKELILAGMNRGDIKLYKKCLETIRK